MAEASAAATLFILLHQHGGSMRVYELHQLYAQQHDQQASEDETWNVLERNDGLFIIHRDHVYANPLPFQQLPPPPPPPAPVATGPVYQQPNPAAQHLATTDLYTSTGNGFANSSAVGSFEGGVFIGSQANGSGSGSGSGQTVPGTFHNGVFVAPADQGRSSFPMAAHSFQPATDNYHQLGTHNQQPSAHHYQQSLNSYQPAADSHGHQGSMRQQADFDSLGTGDYGQQGTGYGYRSGHNRTHRQYQKSAGYQGDYHSQGTQSGSGHQGDHNHSHSNGTYHSPTTSSGSAGVWGGSTQGAAGQPSSSHASHSNYWQRSHPQQTPAPEMPDAEFHCQFCQQGYVTHTQLQQHYQSQEHKRALVRYLKQHSTTTGEVQGVRVAATSRPPILRLGQEHSLVVKVMNSGMHTVNLTHFDLLQRTPGVSVEDMASGSRHTSVTGNSTSIPPRGTLQLKVTFNGTAVGELSDWLMLELESETYFAMTHRLAVNYEPDLGPDAPDIAPKQQYIVKPKLTFQRPSPSPYVAGEAPPRSKVPWQREPGGNEVPDWLMELVEQQRLAELKAHLKALPQDVMGFMSKIQQLLWLEELQHEVDIRHYDMEAVELRTTPGGRLLSLQVPGLAENRPSVMRGDALYVRPVDPRTGRPILGGQGNLEYQGFVHDVRREEVYLRFNSKFHSMHVEGSKYAVRFSISRSTFVFMHAALNLAIGGSVHPALIMGAAGLPPGTPLRTAPPLATEPAWTTVNPINEEQKTAVRSILSGAHAPLPYLIFGPPGTGKTMTLTEAAVQLVRMEPSSKLLLTAPSNMAADQLMLRMMERGAAPSTMYRVCAYTRPKDSLPLRLLDHSNWHDGDGAFVLDSTILHRVMRSKVVVTTCLMAAKVYHAGLPDGVFSHVFIDEAGHAEECLSLCAYAGLLPNNNSARLILAGDPKQLGPVILSPLAQRLGLATSAMERLIAVEPYARRDNDPRQPWNTTYITKLVNNYRSHPDLLTLPNKLFYDNELLAMADRDQTHSLLGTMGFKKLPNPNFPVIFHAVKGTDEREDTSPSWFNQMEAKQVVDYVRHVLDMRANRPTPGDIGVISPYRKQVQKIQTLLRARYGNGIQVGSVEEFQGQERRVILISTVRSSTAHFGHDDKYRLGFLNNPKRFNVAGTRAKALLIVVGNPDVLQHDKNWFEFLVHCYRNGGCTGTDMPANVVEAAEELNNTATGVSGLDTLVEQLAGLNLASAQGPPSVSDSMMARARGQAASAGDEVSEDRVESSLAVRVEGGEMPRWE